MQSGFCIAGGAKLTLLLTGAALALNVAADDGVANITGAAGAADVVNATGKLPIAGTLPTELELAGAAVAVKRNGLLLLLLGGQSTSIG